MPLPAALAQRLLKRGILPKEAENKDNSKDDGLYHILYELVVNDFLVLQTTEPLEEVIAEDYDDNRFDPRSRMIVIGCPNKYNIYHDCSPYCQKRWSEVNERPSPKTRRKYQKLVKKYPLPDGWQQVYDPGV